MTELDSSQSPSLIIDNVSVVYHVRTNEQAEGSKRLGSRLKSVSRTHHEAIRALEPLSLVVHKGESVGVVGTNGSGKSTLMKVVSGQIQPLTGQVWATSTPILLGVNAALLPALTGNENIELGCLAMGMSKAQVREHRKMIIQLSGLEDSIHLPLKSYSSGMAARLQFAIATAVDPDILIIDEALNTGDAQFRDKTRARVDELRSQAGCVLLVSHSLDTIREMCTRTIWLERGELIMDGDPAEVTEAYHTYAIHRGRNREKGARLWREEKIQSLVRTEIEWVKPR